MGGEQAFALLAHCGQQGIHRQVGNIQVTLELPVFQAAAASQGAAFFCIGGKPAEDQAAAVQGPIQSDFMEFQVSPGKGQIAGYSFHL